MTNPWKTKPSRQTDAVILGCPGVNRNLTAPALWNRPAQPEPFRVRPTTRVESQARMVRQDRNPDLIMKT